MRGLKWQFYLDQRSLFDALMLVGAASVVGVTRIGHLFLCLVPMDPNESLLVLPHDIQLVGGHVLGPAPMHLISEMGAKTSV